MSTGNDTPWWDPDSNGQSSELTEQKQSSGSTPRRLNLRMLISDWLTENIHTAVFMLLGLLLALAILCLGFGRALLITVCVGAGYFIGSWRDGKASLTLRLKRFYERWIKDNPLLK